MKSAKYHRFASVLFVLVATAVGTTGHAAAQTPPAAPPTTAVLVSMTMKPDARQQPDIMTVLHAEVRHTVELYLEGKIIQWYARSDGQGVLFIVNATSIEEATSMTETLPLPKANLATLDYIALSSLMPLGMLIENRPNAPNP
jgi:hypothetical protein